MNGTPNNGTRGIATLLAAVMLVFLSLIAVLYLAHGTASEVRTIGNSYASLRALLAAEGTLAREFQLFSDSKQSITSYFINRPNIRICNATPTAPSHSNSTLFNNSTDPTLCPPPADNQNALLIARGIDIITNAATRYVSMVLRPPGGLGSGTLAPLVIQGATGTIAGNATIYNNDSNFTIWSGRRLDEITGSFETRIQINGANDQISSQKTGNTYNVGPDVVLNDFNLRNLDANGLDTLALGNTRDRFKELADMTIDLKTESISKLIDANPKPKTVYIFRSDNQPMTVNVNTSLGTVDSPIVIAVNGNINFTGNPTVYGRIYATGNVDFQGGGSVYGSIIGNGMTGASSGSGNFKIYANSSVTTKVEQILHPSSLTSGSWRDW